MRLIYQRVLQTPATTFLFAFWCESFNANETELSGLNPTGNDDLVLRVICHVIATSLLFLSWFSTNLSSCEWWPVSWRINTALLLSAWEQEEKKKTIGWFNLSRRFSNFHKKIDATFNLKYNYPFYPHWILDFSCKPIIINNKHKTTI